jgi:hypothetical protein
VPGINSKEIVLFVIVVKPYFVEGMWPGFRSKITGNLDETGVEAEVSALDISVTLKSDRGLNIKRGSLF